MYYSTMNATINATIDSAIDSAINKNFILLLLLLVPILLLVPCAIFSVQKQCQSNPHQESQDFIPTTTVSTNSNDIFVFTSITNDPIDSTKPPLETNSIPIASLVNYKYDTQDV